jgi:polysaccharide biosynthesis/export protein
MASDLRRRTRTGGAGCAAVTVLLACLVGAAAAQEPAYVLDSGDVLDITLWNQQELSGEFRVNSEGSFTFPLIGRVQARGQTPRDLEQELRRRLVDGYFNRPQVSVAIKQYRQQEVHVIGEVRQPGTYALSGEITLVAALARAGSTTESAGHEAVIVRGGDRGPGPQLPDAAPEADVTRVDLSALEGGGPSTAVLLHDGDTLFVPPAATVYVSGHVKAPGGYAFAQGMTVLQALSLAGGITDRGASNRVRVLREDGEGGTRQFKVRLSDVVEAGDTIVVPERYF